MSAVSKAWILLAIAACALAAYPSNTNTLLGNLETCDARAASDVECITNIKDGFEEMSSRLEQLHNLRTKMDSIDNGFDTINTITKITKYIPKIGSLISVLVNGVNTAKRTFDSAHSRIKTIDNALYKYKDDADRAATAATNVRTPMTFIQSSCNNGKTPVQSAQTCVNAMSSGTLKTTLGNSLEAFGGALNPTFSTANELLGRAGDGCNAAKSVTDAIKNWPNIDPIVSGIDSIYNALEPMLDFFDDLSDVLNEELCVPNPFELLAEWEFVEEIAESPVNPGNWGWGKKRRRRSLSAEKRENTISTSGLARITKDEANSLLVRRRRASSACFSVQDILDGIDSAFGFIIDIANDLIAELLSGLNLDDLFSLPGMPNFGNIFNINYSLSFPTIDFSFDAKLTTRFLALSYDCSTQVKNVCSAGTGAVTFDCSKNIDSYTISWSWGRRKRSVAEVDERQTTNGRGQGQGSQNRGPRPSGNGRPNRGPRPTDQGPSNQGQGEMQRGRFSGRLRHRLRLPPPPGSRRLNNGKLFVEHNWDRASLRRNRQRGDDKQMTAEEAEEKFQTLTDEQRERLREALEAKANSTTTA